MRIRGRVLSAFERAETVTDLEERKRLTTIAVIGGGQTGVEMAGALAELTKRAFSRDYRNVRPDDVRILLIEADDQLLRNHDPSLRQEAARSLEKLGVELHLSSPVKDIGAGVVHMSEKSIDAETIIWTAGVRANPITRMLGVELDKSGRIKVNKDCSVPGHPEVFAIGDATCLTDANGVEVPGMAPAAMQMAAHVACQIQRELDAVGGGSPSIAREPFRYRDRGKMATIGRSMAVAEVFGRKLHGFTAWIIWLFVHLISLIGFRNKLSVLLQWFMAYVLYRNGARILVDFEREKTRIE
jgi:NADH dehydrogenase